MGKIKAWYRSIPIWLMFFLFAGAAVIVCARISNRVVNTANQEVGQVWMKYVSFATFTESEEHKVLIYHSALDENVEVVAYTYNLSTDVMTREDAQKYILCQIIS